jgi:hypothetical protein
MLLDGLASQGHDAYGQARSEILTWLDRAKANARFVSSAQQTVQQNRVFNLQLALAAVEIRRGNNAGAFSIYAALDREFPQHIGVATRRGLLFEREGHPDKAMESYRQEASRVFLAAYKTATSGSFSSVTLQNTVLKKYLTTGSLVFDAAAMSPTSGAAGKRGWMLSAAGEFSQTFTATQTGRYAIDLIARGTSAGGIWPVVEIHLDGKMIARQYVNSPVWDLFEAHQPLLAGTHWIRLLYGNNAVAAEKPGDRNLDLDKVIVRPAPE